jgi:hypothetical protein
LSYGLHFCIDRPGPKFSCFILPAVAGMTGSCHCFQWLVEMGSSKLSIPCPPLPPHCWGWPQTTILISSSQIAWIIGINHQWLAYISFLRDKFTPSSSSTILKFRKKVLLTYIYFIKFLSHIVLKFHEKCTWYRTNLTFSRKHFPLRVF